MIPEAGGKTNSNQSDAEKLARLLELELIHKRVEWKQASGRYRAFRSAGFVFLFLLIVGAVLAFFFVFSRVNEGRANQRAAPSADGR